MTIRKRDGFSLIELLTVFAIITILGWILYLALNAARDKARQSSCQNNLWQINMAMVMYREDYDGAEWNIDSFRGIIPSKTKYGKKYLHNRSLFCPSDFVQFNPYGNKLPNTNMSYWLVENSDKPSVAVNYFHGNIDVVIMPGNKSDKIAAMRRKITNVLRDFDEATGFKKTSIDDDIVLCDAKMKNGRIVPALRHKGGLNVLYRDGHAKWLAKPPKISMQKP